jgi:phosphoribosylamine--glycine ligase
MVNEERLKATGARLYYAAVEEKDGVVLTTSSRTLGVVGMADSIDEAEEICEAGLGYVQGDIFVRHDIGKRELLRRRVEHMRQVRG